MPARCINSENGFLLFIDLVSLTLWQDYTFLGIQLVMDSYSSCTGNKFLPERNMSIYTCFQCYVHSSYLSTSFDIHLSTSSFDMLLEISQSQLMHTSVCFMSLVCKWVTSWKSHGSGLWLVDFKPSCLLSISKDGWWKISAMHVALKAGITRL